MKNILVICVDYRSAKETVNFVKHIAGFRRPEINISIVVVCNSGREGLEEAAPLADIYEFGENLGYMGGAHAGHQAWLRQHQQTADWVILSNTDINIHQDDFFMRLAATDTHQIIAPDIIGGDGQAQNPFLQRPITREKVNFLIFINKFYFLHYLYNILSRIKNMLRGRRRAPEGQESPAVTRIYAPHGAFVIFGRDFFQAGESLEHITFLYGEELCIAEKARRQQIPVYFDRHFRVEHAEHLITGSLGSKRKSRLLFNALSAFKAQFLS